MWGMRVPAAAPSLRPALAAAGGAILLTASVVLVFDAAAAPSFLVPGGVRDFPHWLSGPFTGLGERTTWTGFGWLLVTLFGAWLAVLAGVRSLSPRVVVAAIVAAHVLFLLAPPLLSADIFGYVGFSRLSEIHHLDPYVYGTASAPTDPIRTYLRWHDEKSAYGPLFTVLGDMLVPLGIAGTVWAFKSIAFAASLATVALVWRLAERRGHDPRLAAALVGLNPVVLAFEVGGGHNDALVVALTVAGIALVESRRPAAGGAAFVLGAATKITPGLLLPFAFVSHPDERRGVVKGALVAACAAGAVALAAFGSHAAGILAIVPGAHGGVAAHSVPNELSLHLTGAGLSHTGRTAATVLSALAMAVALWRAWRGADWITCAGWATLALLLGTAWLLPWYVTWLTPLAALGTSRRLRIATVLFIAYVCATRITFLLA
jgi:Glycosyltransferase family 87